MHIHCRPPEVVWFAMRMLTLFLIMAKQYEAHLRRTIMNRRCMIYLPAQFSPGAPPINSDSYRIFLTITES